VSELAQASQPEGEPCLVPRCRWGSTGTAGGWGLPACDFLSRFATAPQGCLGAWIADEDSDAPLDVPYASWAKTQIEVPDAAT
jgi:hypothetical protein